MLRAVRPAREAEERVTMLDLQAQKRVLEAILADMPKRESLLEQMRLPDAGDDIARDLADQHSAVLILERQHMKKVLARIARSKIEDGSYTVCSGCEGAIKEKRLIAVPYAVLCVRCQEECRTLEEVLAKCAA